MKDRFFYPLPPSSGVFGTLGPAYEANFGGATITITVRARQSKIAPSAKMELGYFTTGVGDSGWKPFELSNEYVDYSFEFSPNPPLSRKAWIARTACASASV